MVDRIRTGDGGVPSLVMIDNYLIDVAVSEEHSYESDVTDYPVEDGADVTDNIRPKGVQVTLHCIVSNTPFGPIANLRTDTPPADECYEHLRQLIKNRGLVTIRTSLKTFQNMALKSLTIPRKSGGGDFLEFTAVFIHVVVVQNLRTVAVSTPAAIGKHGVGATPKAAPDRRYTVAVTAQRSAELGTIWFDPDIDNWRLGAYAPLTVVKVSNGVKLTLIDSSLQTSGGFAGSGANSNSQDWSLYKGRPVGVTLQQWTPPAFQTDAVVKAYLNKFLPNGNLPSNIPASVIQLVPGRVLSKSPSR